MRHRNRFILVGSCVLFLLANNAHPDSPRQLERKAKRFYHQGNFAEAARQFGLAQQQIQGTSLDPAVAYYNRARTLTELGNDEDAAQQYSEAQHTTDLTLQKKAYHNRGNVLFRKAESLQRDQAHLKEATRTIHEARTMYKKSITLDPRDPAPKINYELASRRLTELENLHQQSEQQKTLFKAQRQQEQRHEDQNPDSNQMQKHEPSDRQPDEQQQDPMNAQGNSDSKDQHPPSHRPSRNERTTHRPRGSEKMTKEEADMLLNSIQEEEKAVRANIRIAIGQPREVEKDW